MTVAPRPIEPATAPTGPAAHAVWGRGEVIGMLTRYNRKTVTVITDDGQRWNVSPAFIRKVPKDVKGTSGQNVIELRKK